MKKESKSNKRLGICIWAGGFHLSARTWVVGGTIGKCLAQLAQVEIVERAYSRVRESARRVRMAPIWRVEATGGPLERELLVVHSVVIDVGRRIGGVDGHRDWDWDSRGRAQIARGEHDCGRHRQLATFCRRRCCHRSRRRRYYCATASAAAVDRLLYRWCHIFFYFLSLSLLISLFYHRHLSLLFFTHFFFTVLLFFFYSYPTFLILLFYK